MRVPVRPSRPANVEDQNVIQDLKDTLRANEERCVGMAANMIGAPVQILICAIGTMPDDSDKSGNR